MSNERGKNPDVLSLLFDLLPRDQLKTWLRGGQVGSTEIDQLIQQHLSYLVGFQAAQGEGSPFGQPTFLRVDANGYLQVGGALTLSATSIAIEDGTTPAQLLAVDNAGKIGINNLASASATTTFASAARTTSQNGADQTNTIMQQLLVFINVTVAGTGSITPKIQGKDTLSNTYYDILVGTAITVTGLTVLRVSPHLTQVPNFTAQDTVPRTFRTVITANNANSMTYSVGQQLVP